MSFRFTAIIMSFVAAFMFACTEDQRSSIKRTGVEYLDGNYRVTYADGEHTKTWIIRDGKAKSEPGKGYYYFWSDGKYIQTPIARTYIEEIE